MKTLVCVIVAVVLVAIFGISSATADRSSFTDPTNDLIYIYTGVPAPPESELYRLYRRFHGRGKQNRGFVRIFRYDK